MGGWDPSFRPGLRKINSSGQTVHLPFTERGERVGDTLRREPGDDVEVFRGGCHSSGGCKSRSPKDDVGDRSLVQLWGRPRSINLPLQCGLGPKPCLPGALGSMIPLLRGTLKDRADLVTSRRGRSEKLSNFVVAGGTGNRKAGRNTDRSPRSRFQVKFHRQTRIRGPEAGKGRAYGLGTVQCSLK